MTVKIDMPVFDEQCAELGRIVELLDLSPVHSIASDLFVRRFRVFQDAVEGFFRYREALLNYDAVPSEIRRLHIANHERIRNMLDDIQMDSVRKKNQTAVEVYKAVRFEIDRYVASVSLDVSRTFPSALTIEG